MKKLLILLSIISIFSCKNDDDTGSGTFQYFRKIDINTLQFLTDISFINENEGIVCGTLGYLAKTTDGGHTWQKFDVGIEHSFMSAFMLNSNEFYTARNGIYKTENGGAQFQEIWDYDGYSILSLYFNNENMGCFAQGGSILQTTDGGETWYVNYINNGYYNFHNIEFFNNVAYASGGATFDDFNYGEIVKSTDGGLHWTRILFTINITFSNFVNENVGYYSNINQEIFKTVDGGITWTKVANMNEYILSISFKNEQKGYLSTYEGKIYMPEDGGAHWKVVYNQTNLPITKVISVGNSVYAIGNEGLFLKSMQTID